MRLKPIDEQVVVITGASSGIGLATARMAARRGARLVLAARNEQALRKIVRSMRQEGCECVSITADVSHRPEIERIRDAAVERFGGFDTWVNNAAVSIYGLLEEVSEEDARRLFEVNFWGLVQGSLTAVEHLKRRGGALINIGSVVSDVSIPLQGFYASSKHAVKGFTDALRMELEAEGAPVSVTLIKPASIDTPYPQHARNYMEHEPKLPPPVYPPEDVARAILHAAVHPKREIFVGGAARVMSTTQRQFPRLFERLAEATMFRHQRRSETARDPLGTLFQPGRGGHAHGEHPGHVVGTSAYTRAAMHPAMTTGLLVLGAVSLAAMVAGGSSARRHSARRHEGGRPLDPCIAEPLDRPLFER